MASQPCVPPPPRGAMRAAPGCARRQRGKASSGLAGGRAEGGLRLVSCRPTRAEAEQPLLCTLAATDCVLMAVRPLGEVRVRRAQRDEADGGVPLPAPPRPFLPQRLQLFGTMSFFFFFYE